MSHSTGPMMFLRKKGTIETHSWHPQLAMRDDMAPCTKQKHESCMKERAEEGRRRSQSAFLQQQSAVLQQQKSALVLEQFEQEQEEIEKHAIAEEAKLNKLEQDNDAAGHAAEKLRRAEVTEDTESLNQAEQPAVEVPIPEGDLTDQSRPALFNLCEALGLPKQGTNEELRAAVIAKRDGATA